MHELDADDEYSSSGDPEERSISPAVFNDTVGVLAPAEPVCLRETATVTDAAHRMLQAHQAAVLVVDAGGRLTGIFTERDLLTRVIGRGLDPKGTALSAVMTPNPEVLSLRDRVAYAVHCMSVAGYRTVPLVDADRKPVGIVTVSDVIRWLATLFPTTVLNLPPGGDTLKRPGQVDSG
ncbi:MAG TPA: CBS domain-containing protein [Methylomirabilota bacterium]|nr:CBS domain-containing protein [Methylomirabilota bacterium]